MNRKIGIVGGTGPEGSGLAARWAAAGEHIVIGSRDAMRAAETAQLLRPRIGSAAKIDGAENASAVEQCEIVVLTVPFSGHASLLKQLKSHWKPGHVLIDTTVPLAAAVGGTPSRMLSVWQGSAAQQCRELVPPSDSDILVCSDDDEARRVTSELAAKIPGARALSGGRLENARIVESITALLIGLNVRYRVQTAGVRFTGLPVK